jgi:DNA/RNA endonuclease YhcR with UshA esterase domain
LHIWDSFEVGGERGVVKRFGVLVGDGVLRKVVIVMMMVVGSNEEVATGSAASLVAWDGDITVVGAELQVQLTREYMKGNMSTNVVSCVTL